jgi:hypothetical protein
MTEDTFLRDVSELQDALDDVSSAGVEIAKAASWAVVGTLRKAAVSAAIGTIKREIGGYVKQVGEQVISRVGLMQFPKRGQKKGPHGIYLETGTKYIVARHMISMAMDVAISRALDAAERAAEKKMNQILRSKGVK